jgi:hypothetical protein
MTENQLFNLEKIKEVTSSLDVLQAKMHQINENSNNFVSYKDSLISEFSSDILLSQIEEITSLIRVVSKNLEKISKDNIISFLTLQENLIAKYREKKQSNLKKLELNQARLGKIGLYLVEKRKINKTINKISYIPSIEVAQWSDILDSLEKNSLFKTTIKKFEENFETIIHDRLKLELSKIPKDADQVLKSDFEKAFHEDPDLTFTEFIQDFESKLTQQELKTKTEFIAKVKEQEELEKLKKRQEEQKEAYNDYLKLSDKAFERKLRKKSREKLRDIKSTSNKRKKIEISDEISEKIEKFKSKLDKSFEEKYLVQKEDETDPLDLIRERRAKKQKEYKKYKDHFDNN